jgi:hypothetical protein
VAIHVAYVSFVIVGELLILLGIVFKWRWIRNPWFRWGHLILIMASEGWVGACPKDKRSRC